MTTIVNNPAPVENTGGSSMLIGVIVVIGLVMLLFYVGMPAIRRIGSTQSSIPSMQVVIPDKIDVNVTQEK